MMNHVNVLSACLYVNASYSRDEIIFLRDNLIMFVLF